MLNTMRNIFLVLPLSLLLAVSCNTSQDKENDSSTSQEMKDVKEEMGEAMKAQKQEIKNNVESMIADFNQKLDKMQAKVDEGQEEMNKDKQEALANLKEKRDDLKMKLDKLQDQTEDSWKDFKADMKNDMNNFSESVKDFFETDQS